jgi:hypothetical protein
MQKVIIKNELTYKGLTLLTYKIEYPEFYACGFGACLRFINKYYTDKALEYKRYCDTELFGMAVEHTWETSKTISRSAHLKLCRYSK